MRRVVVALVVALLVLAGCSDDGSTTDRGEVLAASSDELLFLQRMNAHHAQAVQLGMHTTRDGGDATVRALALEIAVGQAHEQGEIEALLVDRGTSVDPTVEHGHIPGMIAQDDLAAALRLNGAELDDRFVVLMLEHHRGALTMLDEALAGDQLSEPVRDLAGRMSVDQQEEATELELLGG